MDGRRTRLLILDDEPLLLRAFARALAREYDVTTLSSPAEALRCLASADPWDVILSDVMMPEMNGVDFARRAVEACPELEGRIVLMTGSVCVPRAFAALEQSALPVLSKPIDLPTLRALLAKLTSNATQGTGGPDHGVCSPPLVRR